MKYPPMFLLNVKSNIDWKRVLTARIRVYGDV